METVARQLAVMGTAFALTVSAPSRDHALDASEAAVRAVEAAESLLSTWRDDTPLARLNAAPPGVPTPVTPELFALLRRVFEWEETTGGAFDPAVGPLVTAWGLRSAGRIPDASELAAARRASNASLFTFRRISPPNLPPRRARRDRRGRMGQGMGARPRGRSRARRGGDGRRPRSRRAGPRLRRRDDRRRRAPAGPRANGRDAPPEGRLRLHLRQLGARPRRGRPARRPHPRPAHGRARPRFRLGHRRRERRTHVGRPLDGVLRPRSRGGPGAVGATSSAKAWFMKRCFSSKVKRDRSCGFRCRPE